MNFVCYETIHSLFSYFLIVYHEREFLRFVVLKDGLAMNAGKESP
jgi:hypothetical protein